MVSCSKFIACAFLTLFVGLAVVTGVTLASVLELRAQVVTLHRIIQEK